jgi:2-dehydro-3-deoxyphosphogluconate aldolase/(4S)-4-hydroxy-2-oxoglutarate aldolase
MTKLINKFKNSPVIPVLTLNNVEDSLKISDILLTAGLTNLEITLRTPNSLQCIEAIIKKFPDANVGAGTIVNSKQLKKVKDIGCKFAISPGFTCELVNTAKEIDLNYLPGASTPAEIMQLMALDITFMKFFHAVNAGGHKMLKDYSNIFDTISFCPTGGISSKTYLEYLELPNVACIGGSWMVDTKKMTWVEIEKEANLIVKNLTSNRN